tara:strand:- start:841 stop:1077 length:237 start_codon:yes stop_codon:yes gene_type:complete
MRIIQNDDDDYEDFDEELIEVKHAVIILTLGKNPNVTNQEIGRSLTEDFLLNIPSIQISDKCNLPILALRIEVKDASV